jgi:hypothetical protein
MRERLLDAGAFAEFCDGFTARLEERRREHLASLAGAQRELAAVNRQIKQIIDAVKQGFRTESMREERRARGAESGARARPRGTAAAAGASPIHGRGVQGKVTAFAEALEQDDRRADARAALRSIVSRIVVGTGDELRLEGNLGAMLELAAGRPLPPLVVNSDVSIGGCGGPQLSTPHAPFNLAA